jgi:flagellar assembly factor FliW
MTTLIDTNLIYHSPKLGDVSYSPEDVIRFPHGIPGFERLHEFLLVTREECQPFVILASLEDPEMTLPLMPLPPAALRTTPPEDVFAMLGEAGENGLGYYAVVTIGLHAKQILANLRAPIVVNIDTRLGSQIILADERLPLAAPLLV